MFITEYALKAKDILGNISEVIIGLFCAIYIIASYRKIELLISYSKLSRFNYHPWTLEFTFTWSLSNTGAFKSQDVKFPALTLANYVTLTN